MQTVLGLASLDLTYRSVVLAWLPASKALEMASETALVGWAKGVRNEGADGVWLAHDPALEDSSLPVEEKWLRLVKQLRNVFKVVSVPEAWLGDCPTALAVVNSGRSEGDPSARPNPEGGPAVVMEVGGLDPEAPVGHALEQLWSVHEHAGPGRVLLLMPPRHVRATEGDPPTDIGKPEVTDDMALARCIGIWSLAAAQGVRMFVTDDVAPARRVVDTLAEILAGEDGPVVVAPPAVKT